MGFRTKKYFFKKVKKKFLSFLSVRKTRKKCIFQCVAKSSVTVLFIYLVSFCAKLTTHTQKKKKKYLRASPLKEFAENSRKNTVS